MREGLRKDLQEAFAFAFIRRLTEGFQEGFRLLADYRLELTVGKLVPCLRPGLHRIGRLGRVVPERFWKPDEARFPIGMGHVLALNLVEASKECWARPSE